MLGIDLIVVPYDSGRRGFRMGAGPKSFLEGGLVQSLRRRGHQVELIPVETTATSSDDLSSAFDLAGKIDRVVRSARSAGRFPLVLAGNCINTVGVLAGLADENLGVVWLDAHGDLNTPDTSQSGFLDGMAAATALGWCHADRTGALEGFSALAESRLLLVGSRDLDPAEAAALERSAVRTLSPTDLRVQSKLAATLDEFAGAVDSVYLHVDLDVLDPQQVGPANSYASPDGLTVAEALEVVQGIGARCRIAGSTVSAYDPGVDVTGLVRAAAMRLIDEALRVAEHE